MDEALEIALLGLTTVFGVLGILMIALSILGALAGRMAAAKDARRAAGKGQNGS